ncbi:MAG: hypothetical protein B7Z80_19280 [Rhodospirillales bacterium 20-64-7]|nr:MAG: hypothetical protein B7Z80_19280 [Rhodospirillales bacterium 20-64-7]
METISGSLTLGITLATPGDTSPTLFTGTLSETGSNAAIYMETPWSLDVAGTVYGLEIAIFADAAVTLTNQNGIRGRNGEGVDLAAGGSLYNATQGTIIGGAQGVYGAGFAATTVTNAGTIIGGTTGLETGPGLVTNQATGAILGESAGVVLTAPSSLVNDGRIAALAAGGTGVSLANGGTLLNHAAIYGELGILAAGGTVLNQGFIAGETLQNGMLQISAYATAIRFTAPGTFIEDAGIVAGTVVGDGGLLLLQSGNLAEVTGFAVDSFANSAASELSTSLAGLGTIAGFTAGDVLHLEDVTANSAFFYNHVLTLQNAGVLAGLITFTSDYPQIFHLAADPSGGTDVTAPCFCAGTRIATARGEVAVENLKVGDLVRTRDAGFVPIGWIGRRSYTPREVVENLDLRPIRIAAGALGPGMPARELRLSSGHAICIGDALVPAGALINGGSIAHCDRHETIRYFHLELARHEVIFAEQCPAESFLEDALRWQFENAREFALAHPLPAPKRSCLPRLTQGFALDAIQRRLGRNPPPGSGPIRGLVECAGAGRIAGWAQYMLHPDAPVCLDVFIGGTRRARVLANLYRPDLRLAGIGDGGHAFDLPLPDEPGQALEVRGAASAELLEVAPNLQRLRTRAA